MNNQHHEPHSVGKPPAIIITGSPHPELFSSVSEAWAKYVAAGGGKNAPKSTQVRRFYDEVVKWYGNTAGIDEQEFQKKLPFIRMLSAQVTYSRARGHCNDEFQEMVQQLVKQVSCYQTLKHCKYFFEAFVGFYKFHKKDQRSGIMNYPEMTLTNILTIKGSIQLLSGLHIGAGDSGLHIGGTDSPVIKNPLTQQPYIPGSSIKGKMRSLLEWYIGVVGITGGKPLSIETLNKISGSKENAETLVKLFGISGGDDLTDEMLLNGFGLTRASIADATLNESYAQRLKENEQQATEVKFENSINRLSGTAESPRNIERVVEGALFDFAIQVKVFSCDDTDALKKLLFTGLKLIEMDALGGSGSRGYGRVKFILDDEQANQQLQALDPFASAA